MAFGLGPLALPGISRPVDQVGERCPGGFIEQLLGLLDGGLAIGLAEREEQIGIVGKSRGGFAQLEQRRIRLPYIPKRRSQPGLRQLIRRILSNRLAQKRGGLRRPMQLHIVDSKPKAHAAHTGPQLVGCLQSFG